MGSNEVVDLIAQSFLNLGEQNRLFNERQKADGLLLFPRHPHPLLLPVFPISLGLQAFKRFF